MPPRDWSFRIRDILDAIAAVRSYTDGMDFAEFASDRRTVDAVVRNVEIIGEAAAHVPRSVVQSHPEIPWAEMRAMRNVIVHEYYGVTDRILWDTVQTNLPQLVVPLQGLLPAEGQ
ncbi:MAG: DUF86 domain-containing protein [Dehalococcoidia bacterium]|jgi:uncharacterized protein with HEPN domain|nr:DUF86 domain-containing protein [Dehalococcoidia bacterium]